MIENAFDYIAIPKGQSPGGPVQSSVGDWYIVVPATIDLADALDLINRQRSGRPVSVSERRELAARLSEQAGKKVE